MATDINNYALSIQLSLETAAASDSLDQFGDQIGKIDEDVASAAEKSIGQISRVATESYKALDKALSTLGDIKQSGDDVGKSFADAAINADLVPKLDDELDAMEKEGYLIRIKHRRSQPMWLPKDFIEKYNRKNL